jgi:hypothetical protein
MKFLTEFIDNPMSLLTEADSSGKKQLFIKGPFAVAETKNKNGRIYKKDLLEAAITKYDSDYIKQSRALGEMNHPPRLNIDFERATHLITEMKYDGNNVWIGKAKVLETPMGKILEGLLKSGVNVGVSTRGAGTVTESDGIKHVGSDFFLTAVDVVSDPSGMMQNGAGCFVNGIMEGMEFDLDEIGQVIVKDFKEDLIEAYNKKILSEERKLKLFAEFIEKIKTI